ncbi:N/A [soil metagenome]
MRTLSILWLHKICTANARILMTADHTTITYAPPAVVDAPTRRSLSAPWAIPVAVGLLLLIATALRLYDIGGPSIWWDEGFSHRWATLPVAQVMHETQNEDYNPPLYYLTLNGWVRFFGDSVTSMRMPSAIASVIAVWLTYVIGCRLTSRGTALCAAAGMTFASFQIVYAHQARCYGLLLMFTLASIYFFLRILAERKFILSACYVLSTAAMLYLHVYGAFFLAMECAVVLAVWISRSPTKLTIKRAIAVQAVLLAMLVPWFMFALSRAKAADGSFWLERPSVRYIARQFERLAGSRSASAIMLLLAVIAAYAMVKLWRQPKPEPMSQPAAPVLPFTPGGAIAFLFSWMFIPHILPIIASHIAAPIYLDRYVIGTTPAMFLLAAVGLSAIPIRGVAIALGVALLAILSFDTLKEMKRPLNVQADELVRYVEKEARPGDLLVFDGHSGGGENTFDYYAKRTDLRKSMIHWSFADVDAKYISKLKEFAAGSECVWVITLDRPQKVNAVRTAMQADYPYVSRFPKEASLIHMCAQRFAKTPLP